MKKVIFMIAVILVFMACEKTKESPKYSQSEIEKMKVEYVMAYSDLDKSFENGKASVTPALQSKIERYDAAKVALTDAGEISSMAVRELCIEVHCAWQHWGMSCTVDQSFACLAVNECPICGGIVVTSSFWCGEEE